MYLLFILALTGCFLSLLLTPMVRQSARYFGLVDRPDSKRKFHKTPVPRVGGVAIVLSYFCVFGLLSWASAATNIAGSGALPLAVRLLPAAAVIFLTGLLDDLFQLAPWQKLIGQVIAAGLAYAAGIEIQATQVGLSLHWWWSLPLTVGWLVLCANAVNLIDGLDGLAAGIGFLASATAVVAAVMQHNMVLGLAAAPLAGALLGFLRYNFSPASVFLGDCGSLFIGFLLGCFGVLWSGHATTALGLTAPLMLVAIPLLDTFLAIARRFLRKHPIFLPDRGHVHHRLLDRGMTTSTAALVLYACSGLSMLLSLIMLGNRYQLAAFATFMVLTWLGIQKLGYIEFRMAGRVLIEDSFRTVLRSRISLDQFASSLAQADKPEDCWAILRKRYRELGFCEVRLHLAGQTYFEHAEKIRDTECWHLAIPVSDRAYVEFGCSFSPGSEQGVVALIPEIIRETIGAKLPAFEQRTAAAPAFAVYMGMAATGTAR